MNWAEPITLRAELCHLSGYGQLGIKLAESLLEIGLELIVVPFKLDESFEKIPPIVSSRIILGEPPPFTELVIYPPSFMPRPHRRTIYLSMWESTQLPEKYVSILNQAQIVLVPSTWNIQTFVKSGVKVELQQVPLGSDFATAQHADPQGTFTFGAAGNIVNIDDRKNIGLIYQAFMGAFADDSNVRLKIKLAPFSPWPFPSDCRIEVDRAYHPEQTLKDWFASLHCFVSASAGEGWGLMQHQALACGRPLIAPLFGAITEYANKNNTIGVKFTLVPADGLHSGFWALPDLNALICSLRTARANPKLMLQLGQNGNISVRNLTWRNCASKVAECIMG